MVNTPECYRAHMLPDIPGKTLHKSIIGTCRSRYIVFQKWYRIELELESRTLAYITNRLCSWQM